MSSQFQNGKQYKSVLVQASAAIVGLLAAYAFVFAVPKMQAIDERIKLAASVQAQIVQKETEKRSVEYELKQARASLEARETVQLAATPHPAATGRAFSETELAARLLQLASVENLQVETLVTSRSGEGWDVQMRGKFPQFLRLAEQLSNEPMELSVYELSCEADHSGIALWKVTLRAEGALR